MTRALLLAFAFLGLFAVNDLSTAQAQTITMRVGFSDPPNTPWYKGLSEFKRVVEDGSKGRIKVLLYPNEQLGSLVEEIENVRQGVQEMAVASPGWFSQFFPPMNALEMPFLVTDWDQVHRMLGSAAFKNLSAAAEKSTGLRVFGTFPYGFRNIINSKRPIIKLADMKGLKLRVQNAEAHIAMMRALGANPVPIAFGETYQALQTGVIDGLENSNIVLVADKFAEVAKYVSETHHLFGMLLAYVNPKFLEKLSPEDRALLDRAMRAAEKANEDAANEAEANAAKALAGFGAKVNKVSPEVLGEMRTAVQPVYATVGAKLEPYLSELRKAANP